MVVGWDVGILTPKTGNKILQFKNSKSSTRCQSNLPVSTENDEPWFND